MICSMNNVLDNPEFTQENESFFTCHLLSHFTCMWSHTCIQMKHYTFSDSFEGNSDTSIHKWWTLAQSRSKSKNSSQSLLAGTISHTCDHQTLFPGLLGKTVHALLAIQNYPQLLQTIRETTLYVHIALKPFIVHVYIHTRCIICTSVE